MKPVIVALIAIAAVSVASVTAAAETKKCKRGQEYDPTKGKCVVIRGS